MILVKKNKRQQEMILAKRKLEANKNDRIILPIFLLGFVILSGILAYFQPLTDGIPTLASPPDETGRFLVPWYICRYGCIPNAYDEEIRVAGYGVSYGIFNVFPYIIQGFVMRFFSIFCSSKLFLLYVARGVNICFGTIMAVFVYKLSKLLFEDSQIGWIFCFLIVYLPENIFIHSYVNTDSCCLMSTAIMVYAWFYGIKTDFNIKSNILLAVGIILCALSYYNAYGFILSSIIIFVVYFLKDKKIKEMFKKGIFVSILVLLGIGWWFIRSLYLYGDLLGFETRNKMASMYAIESVNPNTSQTIKETGVSLLQMFRDTDFISETISSFIARFGSMTIGSSTYMYIIFYVIFILGIVGFILPGKLGHKNTLVESQSRWFNILIWLNLLFCIIMPIILLIVYAYTVDYQQQGRYILPGLVPFICLVCFGINKIYNRIKLCPLLKKSLAVMLCAYPVLASLWIIFNNALPIYLQVGMKY